MHQREFIRKRPVWQRDVLSKKCTTGRNGSPDLAAVFALISLRYCEPNSAGVEEEAVRLSSISETPDPEFQLSVARIRHDDFAIGIV